MPIRYLYFNLSLKPLINKEVIKVVHNYNKYNIILSIMRRQVYKKVIEIAPDLKRQIAMEMGCTVDTVYNALNLSNPTTGAQPDRIRRRAMELGGKENRKIRWINY